MTRQQLYERAQLWGRTVDYAHAFAVWANKAAGASLTLGLLLAVAEYFQGHTPFRTIVCIIFTWPPFFLMGELAYRVAQFSLWRMKRLVRAHELA